MPTGHNRNTARFLPYFSCNHKIIPLNDMYVLEASDGVLRNLRRGPTANLEQAKNRSEETAQKHICPRPSHCLHFNGSNSIKQYNWLPIVLLLFKQTMTSGTRDSMKYIRRGEEGVKANDPEPSENQVIFKRSRCHCWPHPIRMEHRRDRLRTAHENLPRMI